MTLSLAAFAALIATPAVSCDMHGGGMFWTPSSSWQNFSPQQSFTDPALSDVYPASMEALGLQQEEIIRVPERTRKPSFSNAADRASRHARAMMVMRQRSEADTGSADTSATADDQPAETRRGPVRSETDAQPVR